LSVTAWFEWRRSTDAVAVSCGPVGSLCSVRLINGEVYYGTVRAIRYGRIELEEVYYVRTALAAGNNTDNRLFNRAKADWHSPLWMSIPADRILMAEAVNPESQLAKLIQ